MTSSLITSLAIPVVGAATYWLAEWLAASLVGSAASQDDRHSAAKDAAR